MFKGFALYNCRRPHVPSLSPEQAGVRQTNVKVKKGGRCLLHLCTSWTPPHVFIKRFCIHPWVTFVNKESVRTSVRPFCVHTYDWHVLMTFTQVVETSVTCNNNRSVKDYTHPDDHIPPSCDVILGVKPFSLYIDYLGYKALFFGFYKFAVFDRPGTIYSVTVEPSPFTTTNIVYWSWPSEIWQDLPIQHWLSTIWYTIVNIIKTLWSTTEMETRNRISQTHGDETNILFSLVNDNMIDRGCV